MALIIHDPLVFTFGILGNLVAFMVFLAPVPTFYSIYKKKTTGGFHSVPYVVALLSSMLWIYYATLKTGEILLITINIFGCFIESIYIFIYISYAPKLARMVAVKMILLVNVVGFGMILVFTHFLVKGSRQVQVLGWISVMVSISVYIAPLSIMGRVIRTKSVEFMPISLSIALLLNAVMWFLYGLLLQDFFVTVPNVVGVIFGMAQIILYLIYRNGKANSEAKLPVTLTAMKPSCDDQIHPVPVCSLPQPAQPETTLDTINISTAADEETDHDTTNDAAAARVTQADPRGP